MMLCGYSISGVEDALSSRLVEITSQTFESDVTKGGHAWVIDFSAGPWCGPCTMLKKTMRTLSRQLDPYAKVGIVDCDTNKDLCSQEGIDAYPAIRICEPNSMSDPNAGITCKPLENNYNIQMGIILDLWASGFKTGAKLAGREHIDADVGEDGFDFSKFDSNDEGSFSDELTEMSAGDAARALEREDL